MPDIIEVEQDGYTYYYSLYQDPKTDAKGVYCSKVFCGERETGYYLYPRTGKRWSCTCPGGQYRHQCKHIDVVKRLVAERQLDIVV